jgi:hypothetical protein
MILRFDAVSGLDADIASCPLCAKSVNMALIQTNL